MSEGPEVRRTADRIAEVLVGRRIDAVVLRKRTQAPGDELAARVVGTRVKEVRTHGKHIVIVFTRSLYLHNHMMMWGKWRTYSRAAYDHGLAKPPRRVRWRRAAQNARGEVPDVADVREDTRVRLVLATEHNVAVQLNGPLLRFSRTDPALEGAIARLGPDALVRPFPLPAVRRRLADRGEKTLADLLLDQTFVAGVGNKYKSDILFLTGLQPFRRADSLTTAERRALLAEIPRLLRFGYQHGGRTRPLEEGEAKNSWNAKHWVFRRSGKPCWRCGTIVRADRKSSARVTYWCPTCQPDGAPRRS